MTQLSGNSALSGTPDLSGKTAVVTGGASGMGRAMALRFAKAGMRVVLADVNEDAMALVVAEINGLRGEAIAVPTDVSSLAANTALREAALGAFDTIDVVCLNAGVTGSAGKSWTLTESDWDWSLGILLDGVIHGLRTFMPGLVEQNSGHVVFTASIAGHVASPYSAPYMVAKHGVAVLAEGVYHELKGEKSAVGVTCLCPGFVNTDIVAASKRRAVDDVGAPRDASGEKWLHFSGKALEAGLDPALVGDMVHDAILDNQFWLFTDEMWDTAINQRSNEIVNRLPPTVGRPTTAS